MEQSTEGMVTPSASGCSGSCSVEEVPSPRSGSSPVSLVGSHQPRSLPPLLLQSSQNSVHLSSVRFTLGDGLVPAAYSYTNNSHSGTLEDMESLSVDESEWTSPVSSTPSQQSSQGHPLRQCDMVHAMAMRASFVFLSPPGGTSQAPSLPFCSLE